MNIDLADFTIKYLEKKGASYAEARLEHHNSNSFVLKNGNVEVSGFGTASGLGIRFLIENTLGFATVNKLDKEEIKKTIDNSLKLTKRAVKLTEKTTFSVEKPIKIDYKVKQKIKLDSQDQSEKLKLILDIDKKLKQLSGRYFSYSDTLSNKYFTNTEGTSINFEIPRVNFFYFLTIRENNRSIQRYLNYGQSSGLECHKTWQLEKNILEEVKALKINLNKGISPPKGKIDIVAAPEVTGIAVHESGGHPYEADRIFGREAAQAGESFINQDMIGKKIGSDVVTVVDDPTVENSYGFYLYDDEGVKAKRKFLMKNGKINEFLHNRSSSIQMHLNSNGSARANNFNVEPIIRMSNTFMLPGTMKEQELIEDIRLGVYIKNFMEWNIDDVRMNQKYVGNEAYLIKNGKIEQPVKSPVIEITTPGLYSSVDAVANNLKYFAGNCGKGEPMQGIPVFMGGPSIRLRGVKLG